MRMALAMASVQPAVEILFSRYFWRVYRFLALRILVMMSEAIDSGDPKIQPGKGMKIEILLVR